MRIGKNVVMMTNKVIIKIIIVRIVRSIIKIMIIMQIIKNEHISIDISDNYDNNDAKNN